MLRIFIGVYALLAFSTSVTAVQDVPAQEAPPEPLNSRDLAREYMEAHSAGDWDRAIEIGTKWVGIKPQDRTALYCLACAYARSGDKKNAVLWLQESVSHGFDRAKHMMQDEDLASIRSQPGFQAAYEQAKAAEQARFEAAARIEPLFVVPPGYDGSSPVPLIVVLHGAGSNSEDIASVWKEVANDIGAVMVAPQAVYWTGGASFRWGDVDETEYVVMALLQQASERFRIVSDKVVLTGFSQGGYMALSVGLRNPDRFRGVIGVGASYERSMLPADAKARSRWPKFYLMVGEKDRTVGMNRTAAKDLQAAGIDVRLLIFPDLGHRFPDHHRTELRKALSYVLGEQ